METNELELIAKFKRGDRSVFEVLVLKYQDRIYNLCLYMLGNSQDAEDVAQETFIKAYRNLDSFETHAPFYTWIYRIGINTCLDYKKKASSRYERFHVDIDSLQQEIPYEISPENHLKMSEISESVQAALLEIPAKLRSVIVLKEIEDLSYEEISRVLKISIGTVKSRISRARELLRKKLRNKI